MGGEQVQPLPWQQISTLTHGSLVKKQNTYGRRYLVQAHSDAECLALLESYYQREHCPRPHTVGVLDYQQFAHKVCSTSITFQVVTQHLSPRLKDVKDMDQRQSLRFLQEGLIGFEELKKQSGVAYLVDDDMVGYTDTSIKVWYNTNLALNTPGVLIVSSNTDCQHVFIQNYVTLIDKHSLLPLMPWLQKQFGCLRFAKVIEAATVKLLDMHGKILPVQPRLQQTVEEQKNSIPLQPSLVQPALDLMQIRQLIGKSERVELAPLRRVQMKRVLTDCSEHTLQNSDYIR